MKKLLLSCILGLLAATNAPAADSLLINGAGSTFINPMMQEWFSAYTKANPSVRLNYQSIGSGGGQKGIQDMTVNFGASDGPMTDDAMSKAKGGKLFHLPAVAGAVAITYNLPGNPTLKFDGPTIAGIYLGKITKWNDPALVALNPDMKMPDSDIVVVHRTDGSGTTYIFADYLSAISKEWADKVGKSTSVNWPTGLGGKGSEGVSGQVKQTPGSIGYVELIYALQNKLPVGDVKNADGKFITPSLSSVSDALATATIPDDFRFSYVNAPGATSYPISGVTWLIVYENQTDHDQGTALVNFLKWVFTDGQKMEAKLFYAKMPENVDARILKRIDEIKVPPAKM